MALIIGLGLKEVNKLNVVLENFWKRMSILFKVRLAQNTVLNSISVE